jgi:hypothetical protein
VWIERERGERGVYSEGGRDVEKKLLKMKLKINFFSFFSYL